MLYIQNKLLYQYILALPTGSVKVEGKVLATRTEGCEFESQPSRTKDLKNGNRYTQQLNTTRP